jgi:serine/threonine protein kinase
MCFFYLIISNIYTCFPDIYMIIINRYAASADVWSLGLVLCEAVLGDHPLASANESFASLIGSLEEIKPREEEEVSTLGTCLDQQQGFSDEMRAFADWSLAIDPSVRATPEDLVEDDWFTLHLGTTHI